MKINKLSKSVETFAQEAEVSIEECRKALSSLKEENIDKAISSLEERLKKLSSALDVEYSDEIGCSDINDSFLDVTQDKDVTQSKNELVFPDSLSASDIIVVCATGGLAVLVDFLIVRIPKSTKIVRNGNIITQNGSVLTDFIRQIGFDKNGKTSSWIKVLEKYFNVPYDKSIIAGEKGFYPKTHRLYSLAHDPTPSGLLWAIKDILCGTTSYIDKAGNLKMVPASPASLKSKLFIPIIWVGHIISDIFTKAGIPIPGSCFLRTLQFGSFGEKRRTIGEVIEYMYINGYDVRHLATMATSNAVIELIVRIYHCLTCDSVLSLGKPSALIQANKAMVEHRLTKMRFYSYAIASCGNIGKLAAYQWNPLALNLPVWMEFLRTAIKEYEKAFGEESNYIEAVKNRETINANFENIIRKLDSI